MKIAEIIQERVEEVRGVRVWRDPSISQLLQLIREVDDLRGLIDRNRLYVWEAYDREHWTMKDDLGIEPQIGLYMSTKPTPNEGTMEIRIPGLRIYYWDLYAPGNAHIPLDEFPVLKRLVAGITKRNGTNG